MISRFGEFLALLASRHGLVNLSKALSLLHVADNLERAIDSVKTDQLDESEERIEKQPLGDLTHP